LRWWAIDQTFPKGKRAKWFVKGWMTEIAMQSKGHGPSFGNEIAKTGNRERLCLVSRNGTSDRIKCLLSLWFDG
jgi:hypothetical protein